MKHSRYGVVNWFVRVALDDNPLQVFGDGTIKRDFLYVDDCVEAILLSAANESARREILNVGDDRATTFRELAVELARLTGATWAYAPFSAERKAQEPGDFVSDISKIRHLLGWSPRTSLAVGLGRTLDYYRSYKDRYW
jgi:UDP-glucose 4-epimerase